MKGGGLKISDYKLVGNTKASLPELSLVRSQVCTGPSDRSQVCRGPHDRSQVCPCPMTGTRRAQTPPGRAFTEPLVEKALQIGTWTEQRQAASQQV